MNLPYFNDYLPETELIGRLVPNAFGIDEIMSMPQTYWGHFDWLSTQGIDMSIWTKEADICRHGIWSTCSWSSALSEMLQNDEERRYFAKLECPLHIETDGYAKLRDGTPKDVQIIERLKTDNEAVERKYLSAIGVEVSVSMHGKYWRYLDWMCEFDGEGLAQEWVTYADIDRNGDPVSLGHVLEGLLLQNERNMYLNYDGYTSVEVPLYICPIGYRDFSSIERGSRYWDASTGSYVEIKTRRHEEEISREVLSKNGEMVTLQLKRGYWQYLEWLGKQGAGVAQYIIDADLLREQPKWKYYTLRGVLCALLLEDEKKRFESDEPSPLYISPDGYDL